MSLGTLLVGAVMTLMIVPWCYAGICDDGPPGKFCLPDMTGYYECRNNPRTGKIVGTKHLCPPNTRCTCTGIPCDTDEPCGKTPPVLPAQYSTTFYDIDTDDCRPSGCTTEVAKLSMWRDTKNKKYREDIELIASDPGHVPYASMFILPNNHSLFDVYNFIPSEKTCEKRTAHSIPPEPNNIPKYFKYNGTEIVTGIQTDRWVWVQGNDTYTWNVVEFDMIFNKPVQYQSKRGTSQFYAYVNSFVPNAPNPKFFELPDICKKESERFPEPKPMEEFPFRRKISRWL